MAKWTFLKQFDMIESLHICQAVYLQCGIVFAFTFLFSIDVISLKFGRFMSLKYQFFSLTPDEVSCELQSCGMSIDPYGFALLFTKKAVGKCKK